MKKVAIPLILSVAISMFAVASTTSALGGAVAENMIEDPLVIVGYNGTVDNPIKTIIHEVAEAVLSTPAVLEEMTEVDRKFLNIVDDLLVTNSVQLVVGQNADELFYLTVSASESEYEELIEMISEHEGLTFSTHNGYDIYSSYQREDFAMTRRDGAIIMSESVGVLSNALDSIDSASDVSHITQMYNRIPSGSFMHVIVDGQIETSGVTVNQLTDYQLVAAQELSGDKLRFTSVSYGNETEFNQHDFDYTDYTFNPNLYEKIPGKNISMYGEVNDIADMLSKALGDDVVSELQTELEYELGSTGLFNDFYEMLNGRTAFAMSFDSNNIIPRFTFITEITGSDSTAVDTLNSTITEEIQAEISNDPTLATLTEGDLNVVTVGTLDEEVTSMFPEVADFEFSYGTLEGSYYVFSTHPGLKAEFGGSNSIDDNSRFQQSLGGVLNRNDLLSIGYFDMQPLSGYMSHAMSALETEIPEEELWYMDTIGDFFSAIDPWFSYSYADQYDATEISEISLPMDALIDMIMFPIERELTLLESTPQHWDVGESEWYAQDVEDLAKDNVLPKYGTVRPGDDITRAEFVDLIVKHYDLDSDYTAPYGSEIFSDVEAFGLYDRSIGIAHQHGIVGGYGDGRFGPDDTLTRAQAVQILSNYSGVLNVDPVDAPFVDVADGEWFEDAVNRAYTKDVVQGTSPTVFEPHRALKRAEAFALINRIRGQEFRFFRAI